MVNVKLDGAWSSVALRSPAGSGDAVAVGLFAALIGALAAGRPSLWFDEAATYSAATRSLPEFFALLGNADGVHGLYYLLMHAWLTVFPATEFWLRLPSALFIGGAAAGVVVLGKRLSTRSVAVSAGLVFAVLPRVTWAAVEARSYALSAFDAVWLTVLCLAALRRDRVWLWCAYGAALALAVIGNVFVLFLTAAHLVLVIHSRSGLRRWLVAIAAATAAVAPYVWFIKQQQAQVSWIWPVGPGTIGQLIGDQYFPAVYSVGAGAAGTVTPDQVAGALQAWALVAPFLLAVVVVAVLALRMRHRVSAPPDAGLLVRVAAVWAVAPTTVLIGYSLIGEPMYQPQYLTFTAPALALLIGLAVVTLGGRQPRIAIILGVLAVAAMPNYLAQRGSHPKFGMDYSQVADTVAGHAKSGDCLNVDTAAPAKLMEGMIGSHPGSFAGLRDPGLDRTALDQNLLFETRKPVSQWADQLADCPVLWTITTKDPALPDHEQGSGLRPGGQLGEEQAYLIPAAHGFGIAERWQFSSTQVVKSVRAG